ncbi:TPA: hypothetical protein DCQ85_04230 [Candidatus Magasanikbacteria bacterium]|nr:MAG: hypothetical protein A2507_05200 [Candidatus Magasanikbacteria bacterium RIFOXYD12_FULL_33_17]HAO52644.1 hypothetical protein [Candidatus Magasanikbacteria bacterium]
MGTEELWGLVIVMTFTYVVMWLFKFHGEQTELCNIVKKIEKLLRTKTESEALNEWELSNITNGRIQKDDVPEVLYWNIQSGRIFFRSMPDNYKTPEGNIVFTRYIFWGKEEKPDST